jgi:hypothetical protein
MTPVLGLPDGVGTAVFMPQSEVVYHSITGNLS